MNVECSQGVFASHTPVLLQVDDGPVTNVPPVHSSGEADGCRAPIGRLQGRLQSRPDGGDGQDPPTAGDHMSVFEGGACMKHLQLHVLKPRQT